MLNWLWKRTEVKLEVEVEDPAPSPPPTNSGTYAEPIYRKAVTPPPVPTDAPPCHDAPQYQTGETYGGQVRRIERDPQNFPIATASRGPHGGIEIREITKDGTITARKGSGDEKKAQTLRDWVGHNRGDR